MSDESHLDNSALLMEPACPHKNISQKEVTYCLFYLCEHKDTRDYYFKILWWNIFTDYQKELWGRGRKLQAIRSAITDFQILCCSLCCKASDNFPKDERFYYKFRCSNKSNSGKAVEFFMGIANPGVPLPLHHKSNWLEEHVSKIFGEDFSIDPDDWKF